MKALFYGGSIATLAGLALGFTMELPSTPPAAPQPDDIQPIVQQAADTAPESASYVSGPSLYPPAYIVDASYGGEPVPAPAYDEPAIQQVLDNANAEGPAPASAQDVAAAGDTTAAPAPDQPAAETRTYGSIDALLSQQAKAPDPSI